MAYTSSTLKAISTGAGPTIWHYTNTDAHTDVDASGYFTDGYDKGMKLYDLVFVVDTDTETGTMHFVKTVNTTTSAVTITIATLA